MKINTSVHIQQVARLVLSMQTRILLVSLLVCSCTTGSLYRFQSQPSEASVFYQNGAEKVMIGLTPIDYTKSALPTASSFTLVFEKEGFDPREVVVSPTDNSQTIISTVLKQSKDVNSDASLKRVRTVLTKFFEVQELISRRKFVDALALLTKIEDAESSLPEVHVMRGSIYMLLNDTVQAKNSWEKALKIDPGLNDIRVRIKSLGESNKRKSP